MLPLTKHIYLARSHHGIKSGWPNLSRPHPVHIVHPIISIEWDHDTGLNGDLNVNRNTTDRRWFKVSDGKGGLRMSILGKTNKPIQFRVLCSLILVERSKCVINCPLYENDLFPFLQIL